MRFLPAVLGLMLIAGCEPAKPALPESGLTDMQFVDLYVQLRNARAKGDPATFAQRKAEILRKAGVKEEALQLFITQHAHDLSRMAVVWDSVQARINRLDATPQ